ncbi:MULTISPECIES: MobC family plasmid mobilization relaxosome protein [unclassified Aureimonas]|uniref:MobC family plasmid mobilization relaxosome protein n=1 Tax=unclassified Aureimonas TaxID=2615206 RepID=UPI0007826AFA|nr:MULTISPECIES: MobC family plasmid mobilization relaxosome protein [unclassified Aureimonas]
MWIKLRVSDEERSRWLLKAQDAGVTLSALIRQGLEGAPVRRQRRRVATDPALLRELARIGNNLNQIARWANRNKQGVEAQGILVALIEIDRELAALRQAVQSAGQKIDRAGSVELAQDADEATATC